MTKVWERLKRLYGNTELILVTVKSNLEGFIPIAVLNYKKIQEVYEAVESTVTQLKSLNELQYLKEDFGLINKFPVKTSFVYLLRYRTFVDKFYLNKLCLNNSKFPWSFALTGPRSVLYSTEIIK